jgi:hypothetical protein
MKRKKRGDEAARYTRRERERVIAPRRRSKALRWVQDRHGQFDIDPEFPGACPLTQDCWEPLFVVGSWSAGTGRLDQDGRRSPESGTRRMRGPGAALLHDLRSSTEASWVRAHVSTHELLTLLNAFTARAGHISRTGRSTRWYVQPHGASTSSRPASSATRARLPLAEIEQAIGRWL